MLSKTKPAALLSSYNALGLSNPHHYASRSKTSLPRTGTQCHTRQTYATVKDGPSPLNRKQWSVDEAQISWPIPEPPHRVPTPYQILNVQREAVYVKTDRFYSLVKLYHPDRHDHPDAISSLSTQARLDRYRLTLSAHSILSDPSKRAAYDLFGAGWAGRDPAEAIVPDFKYTTEARKAAMGNATWEDWEKWYDEFRRPGDPVRTGPQRPVFLSNSTFISIVAFLAALAGVGQATRADNMSQSFIAQRDAAHDRALAELHRYKGAKSGWNKEQRIEEFLRDRDPEAYHDESAKKMMLDMDVCENGVPVTRDNDLRRKYN
ncbi:Chaperone J-domain-containing protein [Venturia nashicola]|uniref:Chaperone J-domain-containing protein n=1 Tax=Venturia nashicola TaxID=86259 RepID=A0A4Z1NHS0_9PEZI|nr:Chaperone J-domain-containing protein [Venturia nashicola]TLD19519.1 Chaperone J-domain-containing protein [Venturia nashicola]